MSTPFTLTVKPNRTTLPADREIPLFVLIKVEPTEEALNFVKRNPRKVHVVFTIDVSGSMAGEKLDVAKQAIIRRFERDLAEDDMITVVTFGDRGRVVAGPTKKKDAGDFKSLIQSINAEGGTNLYEGLELSIKALAETPPGYLKRIVLATDGVPTVGNTNPGDIVRLAKNAASSGIRIDVYGIGADYDYGLCKGIADASGGWMRHVVKAQDLDAVSKTSVDSYKSTIVDKVFLQINVMPNVELVDVIKVYPDVKPLGKSENYDIGSLTNSPIIIATKLNVKPHPIGRHKLAEIKVGVKSSDLTINFVSDESWVQEDCDARMYYMYGYYVVKMQNAVASNDQATFNEVEKNLQDLLNTDCAKRLMLNDPYFGQLKTRAGEARTVVDSKTKIDKYTQVMG